MSIEDEENDRRGSVLRDREAPSPAAGERPASPEPATRRISDLGDDERPRERLLKHGARTLGNAELIALLLRTGLPGQNVIDLSRELLTSNGGSLTNLARAPLSALQNTPGIGPAKAAELAAVFELASRLARERVMRAQLDSPEAVYDFMGPAMAGLDREVIRVILVNGRHRHIRTEEVAVGGIDECVAQLSLILQPVVTSSARGFFLIHNHPTGDPSPSSADRALTRRLDEVCKALDVRFIDHVIVGSTWDGGVEEPFFSFAQSGLL